MVSSRRRWTDKEIENLKNYSIQKKDELLSNLYRNIIAGIIRFRKTPRFFKEMSLLVGRSSEQCKSKFQKLEEEIYLSALEIPEHHYRVFTWLRSRKSKNPLEIRAKS